MLIEFFGKNFGCFRDEFRLSMEATDIDPDNPRGIIEVPIKGSNKPLRLLRCVAIYGPNASGKSTILNAAAALNSLLTVASFHTSNSEIKEARPFAFGTPANEPCELGARWWHQEEIFEYRITYTRSSIVSERLTRFDEDTERVLLERRDNKLSGEWESDQQFKLVAIQVSPNVSGLALTDQLTPGLPRSAAQLRTRLQAIDEADGLDPLQECINLKLTDGEFDDWLTAQLAASDLGILRVVAEEPPFPSRRSNWPGADKATAEYLDRLLDQTARSNQRLASAHTNRRHSMRSILSHELALVHRFGVDEMKLPLEHESQGTIEVLRAAPWMYQILSGKHSMCLFGDELGTSIHPELFERIIAQINNTRPSRLGQLIFTTHQNSLMNGPANSATLRRDQVYITEKRIDGTSRLFSVSDFKERQVSNMRKRYELGQYGGLPLVGRLPEVD